MKYCIKEVSEDSEKNLTVEVEYSDGSRKEKKTFNFSLTESKENILEAVSNGSPINKLTDEEKAKIAELEAKKSEMESEIGKEVEIVK